MLRPSFVAAEVDRALARVRVVGRNDKDVIEAHWLSFAKARFSLTVEQRATKTSAKQLISVDFAGSRQTQGSEDRR